MHGSAARTSAWSAVAAVLALSCFGALSMGAEGRSAPDGGLWLFGLCLALSAAALIGFVFASRNDPALPAGAQASGGTTPAEWMALAAILLLATLLRAIQLNSPLWFDEVLTLVEFVRLPAPELLTKYTTTNNHILYSLAANRCVALFGESPAALRLPALLFGVASIAALWRVGVQLSSRREAGLACLLLAVSYHHVWFSQNARGYTGILFFTLLGTSLFVQGMRRPSRVLWLGYAAAVALGLYTHLSSVFVFASHGIVYLALAVRARVRGPDARHPGAAQWWPLFGFGLAALLTLQLYAIVLPQVWDSFATQQAGSGGQRVEDWTNPVWTLLELARGLGLGAASVVAAAAVAAVAGIGFGSLSRRDAMIGGLIALPVGLTLATLMALSFHIWPRYFLASMGFALLAGVRGCFVVGEMIASRWWQRAGGGALLGTLATTFVVLASLALLPANYRHPKQDFPGARDYVESARAPSEAVVAIGLAIYPYANYYAPGWQQADSLAAFDQIAQSSDRIWVVSSFPTYLRSIHPDLVERLARDFELVREFPGTLGDGGVSVYRSRDSD